MNAVLPAAAPATVMVPAHVEHITTVKNITVLVVITAMILMLAVKLFPMELTPLGLVVVVNV